jgi:ribosomal protein L40E
MLANVKRRLMPLYRSLTRTGEEQPLHKVALAVVLLLDVFILISIFDGLDVHTRQLASPAERIPQLCREIVIDRAWSREVRLDRLAATVVERRSVYRDPDRREPETVPSCARVLGPIQAIAAEESLGELLQKRQQLTSDLRDAETALAREKGAYDTHLLESLAKPGIQRTDVEAILANVQLRTTAIEAARARLAEIDARLDGARPVASLWAALDAMGSGEAASLAAELREQERWYEVKRLGMQLLFLLPLLAAFATWHAKSARRGRGLQALVSSHLVVVASIPLIFRIADAVYEIIPKRLLKRLMELLVSLKLVALWQYLVIAVSIAAALVTVFAIQRWLFSRERLLERRIAKEQCQRCGKRLPAGARACPFCGYGQRRACSSCGGSTPVHAPFCSECGAATTPGGLPDASGGA